MKHSRFNNKQMAGSAKLLEEQSVSKYVYLTKKRFFLFVTMIVVWAQCFASTGQARHFPQVYCIYDMSSNRFVRHYQTNIDSQFQNFVSSNPLRWATNLINLVERFFYFLFLKFHCSIVIFRADHETSLISCPQLSIQQLMFSTWSFSFHHTRAMIVLSRG